MPGLSQVRVGTLRLMLPAGYSWRHATVDDAAAIYGLVAELETALLGHRNTTLDDIRDQLTEPGLTIDADTWLVFAAGGALAGWAWTYRRGTGEYVDLDVITDIPALRDWLFDQTLTRAASLARASDHPEVNLDLGVYRADTVMAEAAAARGFRQATAFYRMRVDHNPDAVPDPTAPAGVVLRCGPGDEAFRRAFYDVLITSFKDHFGFSPRSFEDWLAVREAESVFDWSQLTLAELDGEPAGVLMTSDRYLAAENCGSVDDLGVLAEARGHGIATHLLQTTFAADIKAGRTGTMLYVDSNNSTGALRRYESVGMRPTLIVDKWCRTI